jgi:CspA family cold shock protein
MTCLGTRIESAQHCAGLLDRIGKEHGTMPNGTVKWFNTTKGYGFIAPEEGGKDVFVHISAVQRSGMTGLADNQKVSFELQEGRDGRQLAADIKEL